MDTFFDVLCVGIMVADAVVKPVDALPDKGGLNMVGRIEVFSGGGAMSASINLRKLGITSALIGKVGNDDFGRILLDVLRRGDVPTEGIAIDGEEGTSASIVLIDSAGERSFLHHKGANDTLSIDDISWELVERSGIIFVSGAMIMRAFDGDPCARFLKRCREMEKTTVLDTALDESGDWDAVLRGSLPQLDYFLPSYEEARAITGKETPEEIAENLLSRGAGCAVIKLGSRGCYVRDRKDADGFYVDAFKGVRVVDTTGAGDAFCSGFLYGLSKSMSLRECAILANAVGAHATMAFGATGGMKSYGEIKKFIEENVD